MAGGVGIEIQESADPAHRLLLVAASSQAQPEADARRGRGDHGDAVAAGEVERSVQRRAVPRLDARDRPGGEEGDEAVGCERLADGQLDVAHPPMMAAGDTRFSVELSR